MSDTAVKTVTTTAIDVPVVPGTELTPAPAIKQEVVPYAQVDNPAEKQQLEVIIGEIDLKTAAVSCSSAAKPRNR
ncbi:MAG: hypothetical protein R3E89_00775 [Thiolinea sp.]